MGDVVKQGDWVMTNTHVGQVRKLGGLYSQIRVDDDLRRITGHVIVPTDELRVIPKEVADIIRSV